MKTNHAITASNVAPHIDAPQPAHPSTPDLLDQITITHGPAALLRRFFRKADAATRARGVTLSMATLGDLVAVNRHNRNTWLPLVSLFDPELGGAKPDESFAILGRDAQGDVVATQGARVYDWANSNFYDEATSLRLFYADPAPAWQRGERANVTAPSAPHIRGRVVFSGAAWYRPDHRGRLLAGIMPRISRALAYTRWRSDFTVTMISDANIAAGLAQRVGYTHVEKTFDFINAPVAPFLSCALVWMETTQMLEDLETFLTDFDAQAEAQSEPHRQRA